MQSAAVWTLSLGLAACIAGCSPLRLPDAAGGLTDSAADSDRARSGAQDALDATAPGPLVDSADVPPGTNDALAIDVLSRVDVLPGIDVRLDLGAAVDAPAGLDRAAPADVGRDASADSARVDVAAGGEGGDVAVDAPPGCRPLPSLRVEPIAGASGFAAPVFVAQAPGTTDSLWVVERGGRIQLVRRGSVLSRPFLDISARILAGGEQGLLGLAFHPAYATNGRLFVFYTAAPGGTNVVAEYRRGAADPDVADATEVRRLVAQPDFARNHNGGMLAFGRDGYLYVGMGDGGGGGDPSNNGLDTSTLLGKLLRLDVDNVAGMFAAAGNPFSGGAGLPQIWAYGLRNPWRFAFDRMTGDLYIGDVGQSAREEIDFQPAAAPGGRNYGWRAYEGNAVYSSADLPRATNHTPPVLEVRQGSATEPLRAACSIIGGYVYRGSAIPALRGAYLFGDYCSSDIAALRWCGDPTGSNAQRIVGLSGAGGLASFGEDNAGELYLVHVGSGRVTRIVP